MMRPGWRCLLALALLTLGGCATTGYQQPVALMAQTSGEYCHKKIPVIGPSDLLRPSQKGDELIDYYGPCSGPTLAEQQQQQRLFEFHRFAREFGDEG